MVRCNLTSLRVLRLSLRRLRHVACPMSRMLPTNSCLKLLQPDLAMCKPLSGSPALEMRSWAMSLPTRGC
eukprot:1595342-Alexandrium_andersonii.AAC.1